jgi:hypothetical protein
MAQTSSARRPENELRAVIAAMRGSAVANRFRVEHLLLLWDAGYRTREDLNAATWEVSSANLQAEQ